MDEPDDFYLLVSSLIKLLLLNGGNTEHVNKLFSRRDDKRVSNVISRIVGPTKKVFLVFQNETSNILIHTVLVLFFVTTFSHFCREISLL